MQKDLQKIGKSKKKNDQARLNGLDDSHGKAGFAVPSEDRVWYYIFTE